MTEDVTSSEAVPFVRSAAVAAVEAVLFLAEEPLPINRIAAYAGLPDKAAARRALAELRAVYAAEGSAFEVVDQAGGTVRLLTREAFHPWLMRMRARVGDNALTPSARETLAVIAYRQPITRPDVEAIRGVGCADVMKQLLERGLIRLAGREATLGRPALYETTREFLQMLGLKALTELPAVAGEGD